MSINIFMKDVYTNLFYDAVQESMEFNGWELPDDISNYIIMLLASRVEESNILPDPNFAMAFLSLRKPADIRAKELGDTCLFVTGVYPEFGKKKGLNRRYFHDIGSTSYELFSENHHPELFFKMSKHFAHLSDFIGIVVNSPTLRRSNLFR